jgi:hypothetical protein
LGVAGWFLPDEWASALWFGPSEAGAWCARNIWTMRDPEPHVNHCFISLIVRLAAATVAINVK